MEDFPIKQILMKKSVGENAEKRLAEASLLNMKSCPVLTSEWSKSRAPFIICVFLTGF